MKREARVLASMMDVAGPSEEMVAAVVAASTGTLVPVWRDLRMAAVVVVVVGGLWMLRVYTTERTRQRGEFRNSKVALGD
jgi:hypothetical protein